MPAKTLTFRVVVNKNKLPRINVVNAPTGEPLGAFDRTLEKAEYFENWNQLTQEQQFEFSAYLENLHGLYEYFNAECDKTSAYRLLLPDDLIEVIGDLDHECRKSGISFSPTNAMLQALISHIRAKQKLLLEKGIEVTLPTQLANIPPNKQKQLKQEQGKTIQAIFKSLSKVRDKHDKFISASHLYDRDQTLSDKVISLVASGQSKVSAWQISCALTVLAQEEDDSIIKINSEVLIDLWLVPLIKLGKITDENAAFKLFSKIFKAFKINDNFKNEISLLFNKEL